MADPQSIGRYEIRGRLGQGGFAVVYLAFDPLVDREVAIKVLAGSMALDEAFRRRFFREARTVASLEHPAIVPIYDFGEDDGQPYFVMRRMRGGTLADRLRQAPLRLGELVPIIARVASALDTAHERGIVHRDVKPGNVLFDEHGQAYLSDFGIARSDMAATVVTSPGFLGTPAYIAPEQARGSAEVTGQADIYALGCMVYECLTGRPPFVAENALALLRMHIGDEPEPPDQLNPDIPPEVSAVVMACLAKDPTERPERAGLVAQWLTELLGTEELQAVTGVTTGDTGRRATTGATRPVTGVGARTPTGRHTTAPPAPSSRWTNPAVLGSVVGAIILLVAAVVGWQLFAGNDDGDGAAAGVVDEPTTPAGEATATQAAASPVAATATADARRVFRTIQAGGFHTCGQMENGALRCWGLNASGQATPPEGTYTVFAAGTHHTCGLHSQRGLICWGLNDFGQATPPSRAFAALAAGRSHTCGLTGNGQAICWGDNSLGQTAAPTVVLGSIAAGAFTTCGVRIPEQTLVCWGDNRLGQGAPPQGTFMQVSVGEDHGCGLRSDQSIVCWGAAVNGQTSPPAGPFTAVRSGKSHSCGLKSDGTIVCWGLNRDGETTAPEGTFTMFTSGNHHNCALKTEGGITCWGRSRDGQTTPPQ